MHSLSARLLRPLPLLIGLFSAGIRLALAADAGLPQYAAPRHFITLAGSGSAGSSDGDGRAAAFREPRAVVVAADGTVFVADSRNQVIRRVTPAGVVSTFAGAAGQSGSANGQGSQARFGRVDGIAIDSSGNLYVSSDHAIRKISPLGTVTTLAGQPGTSGFADGTGGAARFAAPRGLDVDAAGNVYVCDLFNRRVRRISPTGEVTTLAGNGEFGHRDGVGAAARFMEPADLTFAPDGRLYLVDQDAGVIRCITLAGEVSTLAGMPDQTGHVDGMGNQARFGIPMGIAADAAGNLFISDYGLDVIRKCSPQGVVTTVAGRRDADRTTDGLGIQAEFDRPAGIATDSRGNLYVAEILGHGIRRSIVAPVFVEQPASVTVPSGSAFVISARYVSDSPSTSVTWIKDDVVFSTGQVGPHATPLGNSIRSESARLESSGTYQFIVSNPAGTVASARVQLTVTPIPGVVAPTITQHPANTSVLAGTTVTLAAASSGTGPLTVQWFKDGDPVSGATQATLMLPRVQEADSGLYFARFANVAGEAFTAKARVKVTAAPAATTPPAASTPPAPTTPPVSTTPPAPPAVDIRPPAPTARLSNLSIRTGLSAGQNVIVGLGVTGGSRDLLVRAVGPGLAGFGLARAMSDPRLEVYRDTRLLLANEDWPGELAGSFAAAGAFPLPLGSRDAALRRELEHTVSILARGGQAGVILLEAYDLGGSDRARLANVSARNHVGIGDSILIAGFGLAGSGSRRLLIRAVGPGLTGFGVDAPLVDPVLEVFAGTTKLAENDNWAVELAPQFAAVGAFGLTPGSADAALIVTLPPGAYTAQVRGRNGGTGEALVELYELP
ncbi:MAG: immunoglobulin domain-containing protein [Opitutaceae bacterium]|nr:immunoglobulin domain-containing protein [Opitutaceae bacterium]